ncbi:MAG: hypothetical protein ACRD37_03500, partial [Candidatus Acidiferrales bacterium]
VMSDMAKAQHQITVIGQRPWIAADGSPRAGRGIIFEVDGNEVTVWVHMSVSISLGKTSEKDREPEAARTLVEMELDRGWDPRVQSSLELTDAALHWVRHTPGWTDKGATGKVAR